MRTTSRGGKRWGWRWSEHRGDVTHRDPTVESAMRAGDAPKPTNSRDLGPTIGDDVVSPASGEGVIIDIRGGGDNAEAVINVGAVGQNRLTLVWAPLTKA